MVITIIGSTSYQDRMTKHKAVLEAQGNHVFMPAFDHHPELDELGICSYNLELIERADEVHIFWDQRSMVTIFDFGMCFALKKPIKIMYMEKKTFRGVMERYEQFIGGGNDGTNRS